MSELPPESESPVRTIRITADPRTIRVVLASVLVAAALYQMSGWLFSNLRGFLGLLFLAWLFSITIEPVVGWLNDKGLRRGAATGLVLLGILGFAAAFIAVFGSLLAEQVAQLVKALPPAIESATDWAN